jgi:hypothetical protein
MLVAAMKGRKKADAIEAAYWREVDSPASMAARDG